MNNFLVVLGFLTFLALLNEGLSRPQDIPKPPDVPKPPEPPKVPQLSGAGFRRIREGIRGHEHGASCRGAGRSPPPAPEGDATNAAGDTANTVI